MSINKNFSLQYNSEIAPWAYKCRQKDVISEKGENIQQRFGKPQLLWLVFFLIGKSTEGIQVHVKI